MKAKRTPDERFAFLQEDCGLELARLVADWIAGTPA
jgi:hypothetical protein